MYHAKDSVGENMNAIFLPTPIRFDLYEDPTRNFKNAIMDGILNEIRPENNVSKY